MKKYPLDPEKYRPGKQFQILPGRILPGQPTEGIFPEKYLLGQTIINTPPPPGTDTPGQTIEGIFF